MRPFRLAVFAGAIFGYLAFSGAAAAQDAATPSTQPPPAATVDAPADQSVAAPQSQSPRADALPLKPEDARASRVFLVFERYCARCHQNGRLEKGWPASGLGNIMAVGDLARDPYLVRPGTPDASLIYDVMQSRHAPLDVFRGSGEGNEPSPEDLEAVRAWISALPDEKERCGERQPIRSQTVEGWIDEALRVARDKAEELRFISLVNLYNRCASADDIAAAGQAMTKIMNSLSWASAPQKLNPIDPDGTVLSFRLADFGWIGAHWQAIEHAYPRAQIMPLRDKLKNTAGTENPIVRGDWLAHAVSDPSLYYQLLGVPPKLNDLAKMNGVDIDHNVRIARARRAVIKMSEITRGNRLAERHPGTRGGFWVVHDFASSAGDQDLFERPLGPKGTGGMETPFNADMMRVQFTLPNGFLAYALFDAAGNRIDSVLPGVAEPGYAGTEHAKRAGVECYSCHREGMKLVRDDYRARFSADTDPSTKDVRGAALRLSATDGELVLLRGADNERFRSAQESVGIDPAMTLDGEEIVAAMARRYRIGSDYAGAAAELGLDLDAFEAALGRTSGALTNVAQRLRFAWLDRKELDPLLAYLKGVEPPVGVEPRAEPMPGAPGRINLRLWLDKPEPAIGDLIVVNVETDTDCYLTVTNVDVAGLATVIFPNDFEPENLLSAGKIFRLPGAEAPYRLRRKEAGRELLVARCPTSPAPPTGIEHEFSRQRFTVLGNWENFVRDTLITDADLRESPEKAARARNAAAQARARQRGAGRTIDRGDTSPGRAMIDGRAVLVLE